MQDASVGIVILCGETMVVDEVNETYAHLIDRKRHELIGKPLFTIIPETEAVFRPIIDGVRTSGESRHLYGQPTLFTQTGSGKKDSST